MYMHMHIAKAMSKNMCFILASHASSGYSLRGKYIHAQTHVLGNVRYIYVYAYYTHKSGCIDHLHTSASPCLLAHMPMERQTH
jgi:hypothetical protein